MSKPTNKFSPELCERAVRLVLNNEGRHGSRWQGVMSISPKIGCAPQTLNEWVKSAEVDRGDRAGVTIEMAEKLKALERENRVLLKNYFLPCDLERQIGVVLDHYDYRRYHESLNNLTSADVYHGRGATILKMREETKKQTIQNRRLQHQYAAA